MFRVISRSNMSRSRFDLFVAVLGVLVMVVAVQGGLTLRKKCGDRMCDEKEYCSPFDKICQPCNAVCETSSHNYQEDMCQKDCQDYLHDRLYIKRNEQTMGSVQDDMHRLYILVATTLVVCVFTLVVVVVCLCYIYLRVKNHGGLYSEKIRKKISAMQKNNVGNKDPEAENNKPGNLKLEINHPQPPIHVISRDPVTPATTSTPLSSRPPRYPSEETTLDYGAYDNPGLTPSPIFEKGEETQKVTKRESSF